MIKRAGSVAKFKKLCNIKNLRDFPNAQKATCTVLDVDRYLRLAHDDAKGADGPFCYSL